MKQEQWTAVDDYIIDLFVQSDAALDAALHHANEAGLPQINVAPNQGKLLYILAKLMAARSILEIGTLAAYSTIWLGRALPEDGKLLTLELDTKHADVAKTSIERAGLTRQVEVRVGPALDLLPQIAAEGHAPFDLVFIDADKVNTAAYFDWALKLTRRGSLIVVDNVVRNGAVIDADTEDPHVQGIRSFYDLLAAEKRVTATAIQTVGSKGYDGLALVYVTGD